MRRKRLFNKNKDKIPAPALWTGAVALLAVLVFVLIFVIENNIVFTEDGIYFDFIGKNESTEPVIPDFVFVPEIVLESEREETKYTVYDPSALDKESIYALKVNLDADLSLLSRYNVNTVIIAIDNSSETSEISGVVENLKGKGYKVFADISIFSNQEFAEANPDEAIKDDKGELWRDNNGNAWAEPSSDSFKEYFGEALTELTTLGFDGYIFEDATYPFFGNTTNAVYEADSEGGGDSKKGSDELRCIEITSFASFVKDKLGDKPVWYALDVPSITTNGTNGVTGVNLSMLQSCGIAVAPIVTVASDGSLVFPGQQKGKSFTFNYSDIVAFTEMNGGDTLPKPLPLIKIEGYPSYEYKVKIMLAVDSAVTLSPKSLAVDMGYNSLFPELFRSVD